MVRVAPPYAQNSSEATPHTAATPHAFRSERDESRIKRNSRRDEEHVPSDHQQLSEATEAFANGRRANIQPAVRPGIEQGPRDPGDSGEAGAQAGERGFAARCDRVGRCFRIGGA